MKIENSGEDGDFSTSTTMSIEGSILTITQNNLSTTSFYNSSYGALIERWDVNTDEDALIMNMYVPGLGIDDAVELSVKGKSRVLKVEGEAAASIEPLPDQYKAEVKNGLLKVVLGANKDGKKADFQIKIV